MKGSVKIMDRTGHKALAFDTERPDGYVDGGTVYESLEVVRERVRRERAPASQGGHAMVLFQVTGKGRGEQVEGDFDPELHSRALLVPGIAGG